MTNAADPWTPDRRLDEPLAQVPLHPPRHHRAAVPGVRGTHLMNTSRRMVVAVVVGGTVGFLLNVYLYASAKLSQFVSFSENTVILSVPSVVSATVAIGVYVSLAPRSTTSVELRRFHFIVCVCLSLVSVLLTAECLRSVWVCDRWNWAKVERHKNTIVVGELNPESIVSKRRMMFVNRMQVLIQMTDRVKPYRPSGRSPFKPSRITWTRTPSFDPGRHLSFWRRNGVCVVRGPMHQPPAVIDRVVTFPLWPLVILTGIVPVFYWRSFTHRRGGSAGEGSKADA